MDAEDFLATHQDLAAGFSWSVRQNNMSALNTHDTARAGTVMIDGGPDVGAALTFCLPGVPVVFAGDEFGLEGFKGLAFVRETAESSVLVFVTREAADIVLDNSVLSDAQLEALLASPLHRSGTVTSAPAQPAGVEGVYLRADGISAGIWELPGTVIPAG
ncbi:alpha-amylase family glycosyl hydrolase [Arthrobacter sp. D5-1]|uniref:alpha-amylase family glycosyl hydrolase n=1 Tax=Arthrobacter sp. D5-1 TaxID=1477518 RepID=UPI001F61684D|nr:alpha-amylase family glycosyl hydrolase [Arthrobacter sp. D5-1]